MEKSLKMEADSIFNMLKEKKMITEREQVLMKAAIGDRSIHTPMNIKDKVRSNLLKSMIISIFNFDGRE